MKFKKFIPSPTLQSFVRHYWLFDVEDTDIPFSQLLFPFGSFELIINLLNAPKMRILGNKHSFLQPESLYPGQFTKPFVLNFIKNTKCIGVSLQPWMGNLLFKIPAHEFTDRVTHVQNIESKYQLREILLNTEDETALLQQLETHLLDKFKGHKHDNVSSTIAKFIIKNPSTDKFKKIFDSIGISRRRIEQRFLETTGLTMGLFARKVRFQKAVDLLRFEKFYSLTKIGLEAGYYDQAHFIHEFKEFSGITPKEF